MSKDKKKDKDEDKRKDKDEQKSKSDDTGKDHKKSGKDDKHDGKHDDASGSGNGSGHGSGKGSGHGSGKGSHGGSGSDGGDGGDGGDVYLAGGAALVDDSFDLVYEDLQLDSSSDPITRNLSVDVLSSELGRDNGIWTAEGTLFPGLSFAVVSDDSLDPNIEIAWNSTTGNFDLSWNDRYNPDNEVDALVDIEFDYQLLFNGEVDAAVDPASVDIFFGA